MIKLGRLKNIDNVLASEGQSTNAKYIAIDESLLNLTLYDDITSAQNWEMFYTSLGKDYKWMRSRLQDIGLVGDVEWLALPQVERKIIAKHKATIPFLRVRNELTNSELNQFMADFDQQSYQTRLKRFSIAKAILLNNVDDISGFMILSVMGTDKLEENYVKHGIEGTLDSDPFEALFNFIEATPLVAYGGQTVDYFGQPLGKYENTGVKAMNLNFREGTIYTKNSLVTAIMECLREGNY